MRFVTVATHKVLLNKECWYTICLTKIAQSLSCIIIVQKPLVCTTIALITQKINRNQNILK